MFWKNTIDKEHGHHSNHSWICKGGDSDVMLTTFVDEILTTGSTDTVMAEVRIMFSVRAIAVRIQLAGSLFGMSSKNRS